MVDDCDEEKDSGQDSRSGGFAETEESNQTELGQVDACQQVLQSTGIAFAFGVDFGLDDEKKVVAVA